MKQNLTRKPKKVCGSFFANIRVTPYTFLKANRKHIIRHNNLLTVTMAH